MVLSIIIFSLLVFFSGILFLPVQLVIDTENNKYYVRLNFYFTAWLQVKENFRFKMRILFFPFNLRLRERKTVKTEKSHFRKRKPEISKLLFLFKHLLSRVKIKKLDAVIDTGDYPVNAMLIPVVQKINNDKINILINFQNINILYFVAETQLYKLLLLFFKLKIMTKN